MMLVEKTFDGGSVPINYAEGPELGIPLVLLHGISLNWQSFLPVMPALALRYHVFALDQRGHGESGRAGGAYHLNDYVRDTVEFLRSQVPEPAVIAGHSSGGLIALQTAAEAGDAVRAIVLEDPPFYSHRGERLRAGGRYRQFIAWRDLAATAYSPDTWLSQLAELDPIMNQAALRFRAKSLRQLDPDVLTHLIEETMTDDEDLVDSLLPQVTCPVLLLRADPTIGSPINDQDAARVTSALVDCACVDVPGSGHAIHKSRPEMYRRITTDFLEAL